MGPMKPGNHKQLITLTVITLTGFHFDKNILVVQTKNIH
jgi:hypothetical protein